MLYFEDSYKITDRLFYEKIHIYIYYKNMKIKWTLEKFSIPEVNEIAKQILQTTKHVKFNNISKNFLCKNKWGWRAIEKILMQHYYTYKQQNLLPDNLIEVSLNYFISEND